MEFQIIIPMSGSGRRFLEAGHKSPKPLIEVDGHPLIEYVLGMFPGEKDFKFICNERHIQETSMAAILSRLMPQGKIYPIKEHKLGPVYAVSKIFEQIDDDKPTIVSYCDYFAEWDYADFKQQMINGGYEGAIPCYKGFHPHLVLPNLYAGVLTDEHNEMVEIREKYSFTANKMETWQSSGAYYFSSGRLVKKYFQMAITENLLCNDEYYVSLVYNLLKRDGLRTLVYPQHYFCQWGTPTDLGIYQRWSAYFRHLAQNPPTQREKKTPLIKAILVPLAGEGKRFETAGHNRPKPLIEVDSKPMIVQAVSHLPEAQKHLFLCRTNHIENYNIDTVLQNHFADSTIVPVERLTEGQACTCLLGREFLDHQGSMTIGACDNGMVYDRQHFQTMFARDDVDAVIWTFRNHLEVTTKPQMYGWVEVDADLKAQRIHCKKPLSTSPEHDHAIIGAFSFKRAGDFFEAVDKTIKEDRRINGEFYVDEVMNVLIEQGKRVWVFEVDFYLGWGTPDDLQTFQYWQNFFSQSRYHEYQMTRGIHYG